MKKFISLLLVTLILVGINAFNLSATAAQLKTATTASDEKTKQLR